MSIPPQKARESSMTTIFWWWLASRGWALSSWKWIWRLARQTIIRASVVPRPSTE
jgi:hypothetical protein